MPNATLKKPTWFTMVRFRVLASIGIAVATAGGCARHDPRAQPPARPDLASFPPGLSAALAQAEAEVNHTPEAPAAWIKLGQLYLANGFGAEARHCFATPVQDADETARACYGLAIAAQTSGDLAEEIRWLRQTIARDVTYLPAHLRLARASFKSGDTATAAASFEAVLKHDPDNAEALVGLARERSRLGDDAGARVILEDLTMRHPKFSTGFALLAQIVDRAGDSERAARLREKAQARKDPPPVDPWLDEIMASCFDVQVLALRFEDFAKSGQDKLALATLRRIEAIAPDHPLVGQMQALATDDLAVHRGLARSHAEAGRWTQAVNHLEAVRRLVPGDLPSRAMLGEHFLEARRPQDAIPPLHEALAIAPDDPRVQELLALAHVRAGNEQAREGRFDDALGAYEQAIAVRPAAMEAHANRVQILLRLRRAEQADAALQAWLASQPEEPAAWVMLGDVQSATGQSEKSIASWSRARQLLEANPNPQLNDALAARLARSSAP